MEELNLSSLVPVSGNTRADPRSGTDAAEPRSGRAPTLMARLRRETADLHRGVEELPFFRELTAGKLPVRSYVAFLKTMAVINGVLESAISDSTHPTLTFLWREDMRKLPLLQEDLASLQGRGSADAVESLQEWMTAPSRFPERWISAVNAILKKGRASSP